MAISTFGSNSSTGLTAYVGFRHDMAPADVASIAQLILDDSNPAHPVIPASFATNGRLFIPRRGWLNVLTGDTIAVDSRGWPILLSKDTILNGATWTHNP